MAQCIVLVAEAILRLHSTITLGIADTDYLLVPGNGMSIGLSCVRNLPSLRLLVRATFRYFLEDKLKKLVVAENLILGEPHQKDHARGGRSSHS